MSHLLTLFEQHMYLILFLGILLELMAIPISGELLMSYAGYFVYQGKMNYALALLTAFISAGIGITATYWIGRAGGYKIIEKYGKYIHFGPEKYKKTAAWFERSGSKMLVFAYFITGVRHFTGYISGISRMPFPKFVMLAYSGAFLWAVCFISLGRSLGPHWKDFHQFASKYLIYFIIGIAVLLVGFWTYRTYKNQIRDFFIRLINRLINRLKTIRATEIFLIFLTLVLIGMVILMLGLAQDYLYNDFTQFNEITEYIVGTDIYKSWMKGFLVFQSPYALGVIIAITIVHIWRKGQDRGVEFLLLLVAILGAKPFHDLIKEIFSYFGSWGFKGVFHSANFPDLNATYLIIIYGTCLYLLFRHSQKSYAPVSAFLFALFLLMGLGIANIASNNVLPSDIVGGYVYGGVWIFFNFLFFEMLRLVLEKD